MAYQQLTFEDRCIIYAHCKAGFSITEISKELNRHKSTISRELRRNTGLKGYRPKQADWKSMHRKKTARKHIKLTKELRSDIIEKLQMEWSPEQISNHAKKKNLPGISHEWIYQMINQDKDNGGILN